MASFTLDWLVGSVQPELRQRVMLERLFVEVRDACRASLVIGMAGSTGSALLLAVKAAFLLQVNSDVFVAIHAQPVLRCLVKRDMATFALLLDFCVTTNHLPGHQCGLKRLRARRTSHCN